MFCKNAALGNNGFIHYFFTIILTVIGYVLGQLPMMTVFYFAMEKHSDIGSEALKNFQANPDFSIFHLPKNVGLILMITIFIFALLALLFSVRYIHRRSIVTLFSAAGKIDWNRIFWSTGVWFVLLIIVEAVSYVINPGNYEFRSPNVSFLFLLLISLFLLPIQTTAEEIFTRGYLFQAVSYNTNNIFFGFIVTIIIFAFMHGFNPETLKYGFWPMMVYYISAAVLLGLIVIFDDRLELAIGVHTATNIFGALLVTYKGAAMQTDSLFITKVISPVLLGIEIIILGIIFLYFAHRKYKWNIMQIKIKCDAD